jgi:ATP-dependent Clp protease protease subunit
VATDIEIHARELEKLREKINRLIAEETGIPYGQVEKDTDRDYWMNAGEAVQYGLISQVVVKQTELNLPPAKKPEAEKAPVKKSVPRAGAESPAKKKTGR